MTDRRGPGREIPDLREFGKSALNTVLDRLGRGSAKVQERKPLPYDLLEGDDTYLVVFDAPGATSSDVTVHFLDGEVQVRIDRFREYYENYEMRFPGRGLSLDGRVELPRDAVVAPEQASATLADNGSLQVRVPKSGKSHEIEVQESVDASHEGSTDAEPEIGSAAGSSTDTESTPGAGSDGRSDDDSDDGSAGDTDSGSATDVDR